MNDNYDNIPELVKLYDKTNDENIKKHFKAYFKNIYNRIDENKIFEFNFSRNEAKKILRDFK